MSCNLIDRYDKIGQLAERLYTISEASEYVGVPESRLRGWEDEFRRLLKPERTPTGQHRRYTRKDLAIACRIQELLDEDGMTVEGARTQLGMELYGEGRPRTRREIVERLETIQREVITLMKLLDQPSNTAGA